MVQGDPRASGDRLRERMVCGLGTDNLCGKEGSMMIAAGWYVVSVVFTRSKKRHAHWGTGENEMI